MDIAREKISKWKNKCAEVTQNKTQKDEIKTMKERLRYMDGRIGIKKYILIQFPEGQCGENRRDRHIQRYRVLV